MQAEVTKTRPAAGLRRRRGTGGRVSHGAGDFELAEQAVDGKGEPGGVAGFNHERACVVEFANGLEELADYA